MLFNIKCSIMNLQISWKACCELVQFPWFFTMLHFKNSLCWYVGIGTCEPLSKESVSHVKFRRFIAVIINLLFAVVLHVRCRYMNGCRWRDERVGSWFAYVAERLSTGYVSGLREWVFTGQCWPGRLSSVADRYYVWAWYAGTKMLNGLRCRRLLSVTCWLTGCWAL